MKQKFLTHTFNLDTNAVHFGNEDMKAGQIRFVLEEINVAHSEVTVYARTVKEAVNRLEDFHSGAGFMLSKSYRHGKKWYILFKDTSENIPKTLVFSSYSKYCETVKKVYNLKNSTTDVTKHMRYKEFCKKFNYNK